LSSPIVIFDNDNLSTNTTGWQVYISTAGRIAVYSGPQALNYGLFTGGDIAVNTWVEVAVTWDGTVLRFFKDGTLLGTSPAGFTNVWGNRLTLFNSAFHSQGGAGTTYYDALRFVRTCLFTTSYTVATKRFTGY
jgi:hypothetical protein